MKQPITFTLLVIVGFLLGLLLRPALLPAAAQTSSRSDTGRFLLAGSNGQYFVDTATGQAWLHAPVIVNKNGQDTVTDAQWMPITTPVSRVR